jgi:hypothetical protein
MMAMLRSFMDERAYLTADGPNGGRRPQSFGREDDGNTTARRAVAPARQIVRRNTPNAGGREGRALPPFRAKQNQAQPNKSKQKRLDLFGFIRPNRDISMGYDESK